MATKNKGRQVEATFSDVSNRPVAEKIKDVVAQFERRHPNYVPTQCYVHTGEHRDVPVNVDGVQVAEGNWVKEGTFEVLGTRKKEH